jgi:hypothetical protein
MMAFFKNISLVARTAIFENLNNWLDPFPYSKHIDSFLAGAGSPSVPPLIRF